MSEYDVLIVEHGTRRIDRVIASGVSERSAERTLMGVLRNLNTDRFFVTDLPTSPAHREGATLPTPQEPQ